MQTNGHHFIILILSNTRLCLKTFPLAFNDLSESAADSRQFSIGIRNFEQCKNLIPELFDLLIIRKLSIIGKLKEGRNVVQCPT